MKEFLGRYLVSPNGEIYSKKTGALIFQADNASQGNRFYKRVKLYNESGVRRHYYVHRIVASLFIGSIDDMSVDHIDGNQANNNVNNLRIVTQYENMQFMNKVRWANNGSVSDCSVSDCSVSDGIKVRYTRNSKIVTYTK